MGDTLDGTIIINQANTDQVYGTQDAPSTRSGLHNEHDVIACDYDNRYQSAGGAGGELADGAGARLQVLLPLRTAPYTLDIGCGTGLLLDLGVTAGEHVHRRGPESGDAERTDPQAPEGNDSRPARDGAGPRAVFGPQLWPASSWRGGLPVRPASYLAPSDTIRQLPLIFPAA